MLSVVARPFKLSLGGGCDYPIAIAAVAMGSAQGGASPRKGCSVPVRAPSGDDDLDALNISDICRRARVGRSYVYAEIRAGRLTARKFGRATRVLLEDFRRWLDSAPAIEPDPSLKAVALPTGPFKAKSNRSSRSLGASGHNGGPPVNDAVRTTSNARRRGAGR